MFRLQIATSVAHTRMCPLPTSSDILRTSSLSALKVAASSQPQPAATSPGASSYMQSLAESRRAHALGQAISQNVIAKSFKHAKCSFFVSFFLCFFLLLSSPLFFHKTQGQSLMWSECIKHLPA